MPTPRKSPTNSPNWITVIDGWVRDPAVRTFALTVLAMLLIGSAVIVGLAGGAIAALINAVLPSLMAKTIAGAVGGTATGSAIWLVRRRVRRRRTQEATATTKAAAADS